MLKIDTVDSTNNYAMRLIDADKAAEGLTILARGQTAGRGQRGRTWEDTPGDSLLMSVLLRPSYALTEQALFLAASATAIADCLQEILPDCPVSIKWPNDIVLGDKKAGGILIENVVRGTAWQWAVVGLGLNLNQQEFRPSLSHATSLRIQTGVQFDPEVLALCLNDRLVRLSRPAAGEELTMYNERLYRRGAYQQFRSGERTWGGHVIGVNTQGQLEVRLPDGSRQQYTHGTVEWIWH